MGGVGELGKVLVFGNCGIETREYEWIGSESQVESTHQAHPTSAFVSGYLLYCQEIGRKCPKRMTKRQKKKSRKKRKR